ncbi:MAG: hypothetical protein FWD05_09625, partial [Oscillospiraceae bacterium]|nr:hypothetical protein [Oscillospiraceae bacterium]
MNKSIIRTIRRLALTALALAMVMSLFPASALASYVDFTDNPAFNNEYIPEANELVEADYDCCPDCIDALEVQEDDFVPPYVPDQPTASMFNYELAANESDPEPFVLNQASPRILVEMLQVGDVVVNVPGNLGIFLQHSPLVVPVGRTLYVQNTLNVQRDAELIVEGRLVILQDGRLNNQGNGSTITIAAGGVLENYGRVENVSRSYFVNNGLIINNGRIDIRAQTRYIRGTVEGNPPNINRDAINLFELNYDIVIDVLEWGSAVTAVVVELDEPITAAELVELDISINAEIINPVTGAVAFDGPRVIRGAYLSVNGTIEHTLVRNPVRPGGMGTVATAGATEGRFIIVELTYGFGYGASQAVHWQNNNRWSVLNYTVMVDGEQASYNATVRPLYDDFIEVKNHLEGRENQRFRMYVPEGEGPFPV